MVLQYRHREATSAAETPAIWPENVHPELQSDQQKGRHEAGLWVALGDETRISVLR
jgi:hypothetical protein